MTHIEIDFETRSPVDLRTHGAAVYFESPEARVLIGSYQINHGPIRRWEEGQPCPPDLVAAIESGAEIWAFNVAFEMLCFDWLHANAGWPLPRPEQFRCTAATAAAMALPRALGDLGEALGLSTQKDKEGARLMRMFSIPDKHGNFKSPADHPAEWEAYKRYCDIDVLTEAEADKRLVPLSDFEQQVWQMSERINRRGVRIDRVSARAAIRLAEKAKALLDAEMRATTGGAVTACSQVAKLVAWVQDQGVDLSSAAKAELTDALGQPGLPDHVRHALELRQEAAKTSVAKLEAMLKRASADGRVRGSFIYHGASTGRWVNTGVNFANMPRPRRAYDEAKPRADVLFSAFRQADPSLLKMLYGDALGRPLHLVSDAIRGFIWAAPGHDLVQADYSGIEGAVIAWLAREEWKLTEMRAIIADPSRPDLYRQTAAGIMNTTTDIVTKKHPLRQSVGKTSELALGFQGGVSAFYTMARNYGVDLDGLYAPVWEVADEERRERAVKRYENAVKRKQATTEALSRQAWIACEIIKHGWRAQNAAIATSWKAAETAVREAVQNPGTVTEAARCRFIVRLGFLWTMLPSGRCLAYGGPKLKDQVWAQLRCDDGSFSDAEVTDRELAEALERKGQARIQGTTSAKVTFLGVDSATKKWRRQALYGGLIMQNNTQATARDLLVNGMLKAEAAGYGVIAHVYDEIIAEVPKGFGDLADFERLICELPEWVEGMPLTAGGWRGKRYRKD
jgi:DNA polymerase bacteriophage-type